MRITVSTIAIMIALAGAAANAQRRSSGSATLVMLVTEPSGSPLTDVRVTVQGPARRESRTERGRIVFEGLPSGTYRVRFEREGYLPVEREVVARGGKPVDVKVALTRAPKPTPPIRPVGPLPPSIAEPIGIDMPTFIEKNYIGRAAGKTSALACAAGGSATLLQLHDPLADHMHNDADEYLYVIAGDGTARAGRSQQELHPGVFMLVPRGVLHSMSAAGRSPLVVLSIKAGERCSPAGR